jgi:hypothetical protein
MDFGPNLRSILVQIWPDFGPILGPIFKRSWDDLSLRLAENNGFHEALSDLMGFF